MSIQQQVSRAIRILRGNRDVSARASHLVVQKDQLMTYESVFGGQATDGISPAVTNFFERKSMSTKTTFKRVALAAVVALGLGGFSAVSAYADTEYVTSSSVSTDKAPIAASANGTVVVHTVTFQTSTTGAVTVKPTVVLTSRPTGSTMAVRADATSALTSGQFQFSQTSAIASSSFTAGTSTVTTAVASGATYSSGKAYLHAFYDKPGTYVYTIFDNADGTGYVSGSDYATTLTVVVADSGANSAFKTTITPINAATASTGTYGALVKISLTDAAGNPATPDVGSAVKVSVSGSAIIAYANSSANTTATYNLSNSSFDAKGNAWINVTDATAESVLVSTSGVGGYATSLTNGTVGVVSFTAPVAGTSVLVNPCATSSYISNVTTATASLQGAGNVSNKGSFNLCTTDTTTTNSDIVTITATYGYSLGGTKKYDILVAGAATGGIISLTPTWTTSLTGVETINVAPNASTYGYTVTAVTPSAGSVSVVYPTTAYKAAVGSTQSFTVKVKDAYGNSLANQLVSASIAGRNSTVVVASGVTGASGTVTLSWTDVSTSTTSLVDTVTFSSGSATTASAAVTYASTAALGVSTVKLATNDTSSTGAALAVVTPVDIAAGATADGAENASSTATATVKDVNGVPLSGIPVTFSVAGTGAAILSTSATKYTATDGTAAATLYCWIAGTYTVTATAGGVSASNPVTCATTSGTAARVLSGTVVGNNVVAKVVDRFGNPVKNVTVSASTDAGYFGSGVTSTTGVTDSTGTVAFVLLGAAGNVTLSLSATSYPQSIAIAGSLTAYATGALTATTAGTATTAESGVGASLAPAGVSKVVLAATGNTAAVDAAQAAQDAANEATDAANAATDAANNAMDSADAATAAAQDAGDKADAALAAITDLATKVSDIATQVSSLSAVVAKIAAAVAKISAKVKA
jgi:trimeric autotransporter adhesin